MSKRLVQVAKELNVGTKTIVDFLNTHGFEVSNKPTAKVSGEQYDLLVRNFQKSMDIKEKANKIAIGTTRKKDDGSSGRKKRPMIKPLLKSNLPPKQEEKEEPKVKQAAPESKPKSNNTTKNPEVKVNTPQVTGPKIVGKIDLDALGGKKPKVDNKKKVEEKTSTPAPQKVEKVEQKKADKKQSEKTVQTPEKNTSPQTVDKSKKEPVSDKPAPKKEVDTPPVTSPEKGKSEGGSENIEKTEDGEIKVVAPQLKGLKILGKINIEPRRKRSKNSRNNKNRSNNRNNSGDQNSGDKKQENAASGNRGGNRNDNRGNRNDNRGNRNDNRGGNRNDNRGNRNDNRNDNRGANRNDNRGNRNDNRGNRNDNRNDNRGANRNDNRGNRNDNRNDNRGGNRNDNRGNRNDNCNDNRGGNRNDNRGDNRGYRGNRNDRQNNPQRSEGNGGQNFNKPQESSSGDNNDRKKRRERIRITPKGGDNKNSRNNNDRNKDSGDRRRKGGKRKEITKKEIDDKVRATMALMRGGKKGKRGGKKGTRSQRDERKEQRLQKETEEQQEVKKLQVTEFISVSELASLMDVSATEVIMACMKADIYVSINQRLDSETIELVALEYGFEVEFISAEDQIESEYEEPEDDEKDLKPRSPIVTVMGHVDHGKTSLLDRIREAKVADGEAGGITQHIGAYEVEVPEMGTITFLDTPGHEAFTAMRARGAQVTDVAVIIIAADDNIMPQTKEAISHAQAANVPIIFAINKIDKEGANPERVKQELASLGFLVEDWGGKYQSQDISAKKNINIDLLLEKILLESEMLELKANPDRLAYGTVLEASMEKGRGYVTKILVQAGTLTDGQPIIAGHHSGRVRAMFNEFGKRIKKAGPSTPVLILGLQGAPQAGERIKVMPSERDAKDLASKRGQLARQQQIRATRRTTLDEINRRLQVGNFQELNLIVKGDMDGSVEALSDSLLKLANEQVQTRIVHKAVGPVSESDVNLAAASDAIIIGFQVRPNPMAKKLAENEGVEIKTYSIIYDAIEEIKSALEGMLEPKKVEEELGQVEIQHVFNISKVGKVAGCFVREGKILRNSYVRIIRDGIVMYPKKEGVHGKLASLKRFKDNVSEVKAGFECGLSLEGFDKIKEGDIVEAYTIKEVKQTLD